MLTKLLAIAIICAVILYYLRSSAPEFFTPALIVSSVILVIFVIEYVLDFISFFQEVSLISGISGEMILLILKILAISYLIEFTAGIIMDMQLNSLADKVVFAGKIIVFSLTLPIIKQIITLLMELL